MSKQTIDPVAWQYGQLHSAEYPGNGVDWVGAKHFPTEIHWELREAGKIANWNKGRAEHDVQWVSEKHWGFRSTIKVDEKQLKCLDKAELEFESLDTFATVFLNGKQVLETDNHFTIHTVQVPIKDLKAENELLITFKPPEPIATEIAKQYGPFRGGSCNLGNRARMGIRKSQYHFRWDWGPELKCMGPDRPIHLHLYSSRIKEVNTSARVNEALQRSLNVQVEIEGSAKDLRIELKTLDGKVVRSTDETKGKLGPESAATLSGIHWDLGEDVELWWPVNEGKQTRYEVTVDLLSEGGEVVDTFTRKIGFRRMELVQRPLDGQEGSSFFFRVNNKPTFMSGSNWIPIDNVLPSGTPERYRRWLEFMVKGNQNMIRIWGGGIFEPDCFYDLCDELGILVWQDFMFACGVYPIFPEFMKSVQREAECNIKRLRHHPSMALFCGNNEDYQMILQWDMDQSGDPLPARKIYEHLLPETVTKLTDPEIPYWRGSPYGGKGWDTADPTIGDVHQWDVWGGKEKYYQDWDILGGRFVSEFGMPSLPDIRTIDYWLDGDKLQRYAQSRLMSQHNKAGSHERRLAIYMNENFRVTEDLEKYAYLTRLMQSEAIGLSYSLWRREWRGDRREYCAGVLVWQLNDCWPVSSWAIIDYFYRPKPAYFAIKRTSAPLSIGIRRTVAKNRETDRPRTFYEYGSFQSREVTVEVWAHNTGATRNATIELYAVDLNTPWKTEMPKTRHKLFNGTTELKKFTCPAPVLEEAFDKGAPSGSVVLHARITDGGEVLARTSNWPEPYKVLDLPDPGLDVKVDGEYVTVSSELPCKGVWLDVEGENEGVEWEDNGFDVFPGDEQKVKVSGLTGKKLTVAYLGKEKASAV